MKDRLVGNKAAKVLSLLAALVMPICVVDMGTTNIIMDVINPYYLLFCGFYQIRVRIPLSSLGSGW